MNTLNIAVESAKSASISSAIFAMMNTSSTLQQAFDAAPGAGAYTKMACELYDSLRSNTADAIA